MAKKFGISRVNPLFKISVVKFVNKYPRMKKSSLSLPFSKNNFEILKKFVIKMIVNLNRSSIFLANIFISNLF